MAIGQPPLRVPSLANNYSGRKNPYCLNASMNYHLTLCSVKDEFSVGLIRRFLYALLPHLEWSVIGAAIVDGLRNDNVPRG